MKSIIIFFIILAGVFSLFAQAQESKSTVYDYALLKREFIGKNDIFTINYRSETGKTKRIEGFIRVSSKENHITVYLYNAANRNYDLIEILVSNIQSIIKSESQKIVTANNSTFFTARRLLKAAGIVVVAAAVALFIFRDEL